MADEQGKGSSLSGIAVLVAACAATYFAASTSPKLRDARPLQPDAGLAASRSRMIEARLWEDPFEAVRRGLKRGSAPATCDVTLRLELGQPADLSLSAKADRAPCADGRPTTLSSDEVRMLARGATRTLAVVVPADPYEEAAEARRRRRYGVAAALQVAGYAPHDSGHLRIMRWSDAPCDATDQSGCVAFEQFDPTESDGTSQAKQETLVFWLPENNQDEHPLRTLNDFAESIGARSPSLCKGIPFVRPRLDVLGPSSSDGLKAIFAEMEKPEQQDRFPPTCFNSTKMRLLDFAATEVDRNRVFGGDGSAFMRLGADDGLLADKLLDELAARGLGEAGSTIFLLSDWDTTYGRELSKRFQVPIHCPKESRDCETRNDTRRNVVPIYYLRGIDGRLAGDTRPSPPENGKEAADKQDAPPAGIATALGEIDPKADGRSQADYLERLARYLKARSGTEPVGAIGLLGTDVYDKLLILQAFRPLFPHTLFFTTDMDARLLGPDTARNTHNLVIASGFGLDMPHWFRQQTLPFRDSYETAAFVTAYYALTCDMQQANAEIHFCKEVHNLNAPKIYEVARSGRAVELFPDLDTHDRNRFARAAFWTNLAAILCVLGGAVFLTRVAVRQWLVRPDSATDPNHETGEFLSHTAMRVCLLGGLFVFLGGAVWPGVRDRLTANGSSLAVDVLGGTSLLPVIWVNIGTSVLACWFGVLAISWLNSNTLKLVKEFDLLQKADIHNALRRWPKWDDLRPRPGQKLPEGQLRRDRPLQIVDVPKYWRDNYLQRGAISSRLVRSLLLTVIIICAWWLLDIAYPREVLAIRGQNVVALYLGSEFACLISAVLLVSLVFDATMNSLWLVNDLKDFHSKWKSTTLHSYEGDLGFTGPSIADWIDLQFVSIRTGVTLRLIWLPCIVVAIVILSQGAAGEMVGPTVGGTFIEASALLLSAGCVIALRFQAEQQRRRVVAHLEEAIMCLRVAAGPPMFRTRISRLRPNATKAQLDFLLEKTRSLDRGAFAPVLQQPLLKAIILPVAAYGLPLLSQYFGH